MDVLNRITFLEHSAADFGFAWENTTQIMAQIQSECEEVQAHLKTPAPDAAELQEEIGDLLHAVFSLCVFCEYNPYVTLQKTLDKFEKRLNLVKQLATAQGLQTLKGHSFDELMQFWAQAKKLITSDKIASAVKKAPDFLLNEQLASSCFKLIDWPLSCVLLKNETQFPWFILVPRRDNITEMTELSQTDRYQLMDEITALSSLIQEKFQPHKINTGSLGNIVAQCHIHVVGRFRHDPLWPQSIWQAAYAAEPYHMPDALILDLQTKLMNMFN